MIKTTEIGSLPFIHTDAAIEHAFRVSVPFLPQLPKRNPREFMVAQALDGLPGMKVEDDGTVSFNAEAWARDGSSMMGRLETELSRAVSPFPDPKKLEAFEPTAESASCWNPFLFELEERKTRYAKVQLAGPVTCQWTAQFPSTEYAAEIQSSIVRFVLLRGMAMASALRSRNVEPLLFLDEPALTMLEPGKLKHQMALKELSWVLQSLQRSGISTGLHCCGQTDGPSLLQLPIQFLSIDAGVAGLAGPMFQSSAAQAQLQAFFDRGGKLALGVIPTSLETPDSWEVPLWVRPHIAMVTPACGLGLLDVAVAETIASKLLDWRMGSA